jgi:hypothetical protein
MTLYFVAFYIFMECHYAEWRSNMTNAEGRCAILLSLPGPNVTRYLQKVCNKLECLSTSGLTSLA